VLRNVQMLELQRPSRQVHAAFEGYVNNVNMAKPFPKLAGIGSDIYDNRNDLISLVSTHDEDRLTTLLRSYCPSLFRRKAERQNSSRTSVQYLSEPRLSIFVGLVNVVVAASMLFGAIFNLFYVQNEKKRLGILAGYTMAFALCIGFLSNAKRSEIFSASAAYAAVLVVFVSSDFGRGDSSKT
jgi:hypothetical protein